KAGLEAARARGRTGGRPPSLFGDKLRTARKLYEPKDMTVAQIGAVLAVSRTTVYRALRKETGVLPTRLKDPSKSTQPRIATGSIAESAPTSFDSDNTLYERFVNYRNVHKRNVY